LDEDSEEFNLELETLDDNVKKSLCLLESGVEDLSCFEEFEVVEGRALSRIDGSLGEHGQQRALFKRFRRRLRRAFKKVKKAVKKVVEVVKTVASVVADVLSFLSIEIDKTVTFVDIDKSAKLTCEAASENGSVSREGNFELGVQMDLSARAQLKVRIGLPPIPVNEGSIRLFGGFGVKGYMLLAASAKAELTPDPIKLFRLSRTFTVFLGPVPIVVTARPSVDAFMEASAVVEAEAVAAAQFGYDYSVEFSFNLLKGEFNQKSSFIERPPLEEDPEFSLRLKAEAEMGVTFGFDVLFFSLLQGTIAADLGIAATLEVGTDLESMAVTPPFFYQLNEFAFELFVRIRASVGLNSDIGEILQEIADGGDDGPTCTFEIDNFKIPERKNDANATVIPTPLELALEKAKESDEFVNKTIILLEDLEEAGLLDDPYEGVINALQGQGEPLGVGFVSSAGCSVR